MLIRAQEMARYVCEGVIDAGLTGLDWIAEHSRPRRARCVTDLADLVYSNRASARCGGCSPHRKTRASRHREDLDGAVIATELVQVTRALLRRIGVKVKPSSSPGARPR